MVERQELVGVIAYIALLNSFITLGNYWWKLHIKYKCFFFFLICVFLCVITNLKAVSKGTALEIHFFDNIYYLVGVKFCEIYYSPLHTLVLLPSFPSIILFLLGLTL